VLKIILLSGFIKKSKANRQAVNFTGLPEMSLQSKRYNYFYTSLAISLFIFIITGIFLSIYGKTASFLAINHSHNDFFDFLFTWFTYFGDILIWAPLLIYCFIKKRDFFLLFILGLIISTLITQTLKRVVFPDELRPILELKNYSVHTIKGVLINHFNSFPSGHTGTAFTIALLLSFMFNHKWASYFLPLLAFGVAYSRVYQGQHFVTDVFAGMFIGMFSAYSALLIYKKAQKKKQLKPKNKNDPG
jgi:membrane-associated phospholipid phosphatase